VTINSARESAAVDLDHHRERVQQELDLAYRASTDAASAAHFKLAALHMREVDINSSARPAVPAEPSRSVPAAQPAVLQRLG
jgi:hypothetical protein